MWLLRGVQVRGGWIVWFFFCVQAEDGIRDFCLSRGLRDVYKIPISQNVTLIAYIQTDTVTVYRQEMEELAIQKAGMMLELKLLRGN